MVPVADAPDADATLRSQVEDLQNRLDNRDRALESLVSSGRMGRSVMAVPHLPTQDGDFVRVIDGMVEAIRADGDRSPALCAVVSRGKERLAAFQRDGNDLPPKGKGGQAFQRAIHDAPRLLKNICRAAEADGLIGNLDAGWQ